MLDSSLWPNYVSVLKWFFIPQSTEDDAQQAADKRRRIDGDNIGRTVETIRRPGGALTSRMPVLLSENLVMIPF